MHLIVFPTILWELQLPIPVILDSHWMSLLVLRQGLVLMMVIMMLKEYLIVRPQHVSVSQLGYNYVTSSSEVQVRYGRRQDMIMCHAGYDQSAFYYNINTPAVKGR